MNVALDSTSLPSHYLSTPIEWQRILGSPRFDYKIDYWVAVLNVQPEQGRIDFLSRWEPNAYCHFHRHIGNTTTVVLDGEQHVIETTPTETVHKVRKPGFVGHSAGGDVHMERGGPDGAVVLFSCQAGEGGKLFDVLDANGRVLVTATIDDFLNGRIKG